MAWPVPGLLVATVSDKQGMEGFVAWPPPQAGRCPLCEEPIGATDATESLVAGDAGWRPPRHSAEVSRAFKAHCLCAQARRRDREQARRMAGP